MKYRFEIIYANKWCQVASKFLSKMDLGIDDIGTKEVMTFSCKKDLSISAIKDVIKQAYESCECKVLQIEGGKVE